MKDDLKDIECRNVFCVSCDGKICMIFDRKSQLNKCLAKKQFDAYVKYIDRQIEVDAQLSKIFDTDEWWWHRKTGEPFSSGITNCLNRVKDKICQQT